MYAEEKYNCVSKQEARADRTIPTGVLKTGLPPQRLFGDGLAIWFTTHSSIIEGPAHGFTDRFTGWGIILDTFVNTDPVSAVAAIARAAAGSVVLPVQSQVAVTVHPAVERARAWCQVPSSQNLPIRAMYSLHLSQGHVHKDVLLLSSDGSAPKLAPHGGPVDAKPTGCEADFRYWEGRGDFNISARSALRVTFRENKLSAWIDPRNTGVWKVSASTTLGA